MTTTTTTTAAATQFATPQQTADRLRPVVRQWVGQTFFGTLMKHARSSPLSAEDNPFAGGRGGQAFGEMLDGRLAEFAAAKQGGALVETLTNRLAGLPRQTPPAAPQSAPPPPALDRRL